MSNEALKDCPFCGGKPYIIQEKMNGLWEVGCGNRRCKLAVYTRDMPEKKKVIAAWNKRVQEVIK